MAMSYGFSDIWADRDNYILRNSIEECFAFAEKENKKMSMKYINKKRLSYTERDCFERVLIGYSQRCRGEGSIKNWMEITLMTYKMGLKED